MSKDESGEPTADLAIRIRRHAVQMTNLSGASHIGSCLSIADLLAVLYSDFLQVDSAKPDWEDRDRFILSKGHATAALYAALAESGFFHLDELQTHCQNGSRLMGHASHKVPGIELSTGSLGHGLPYAAGIAYSGKLDNKTHRVIALLSDGECDEGSNWEAILFAAHHKLDNLIAIVDYNKIQSLKSVSDTLGLEPFVDKWTAFGWGVREIDGHDHEQIEQALVAAPFQAGKPSTIIAHTTKGKGVSFMENSVLWHYRSPKGDEFDAAMAELN